MDGYIGYEPYIRPGGNIGFVDDIDVMDCDPMSQQLRAMRYGNLNPYHSDDEDLKFGMR